LQQKPSGAFVVSGQSGYPVLLLWNNNYLPSCGANPTIHRNVVVLLNIGFACGPLLPRQNTAMPELMLRSTGSQQVYR